MHLFLSGKPACGKTTLIKVLIKNIPAKRGFFSEEIRERGERTGFKIITLKEKKAVFAHKNFSSSYKVSKYKINLDIFNTVAVRELEEALKKECEIVVIDELGKMELLSQRFKEVVLELLDRKKILGTIPFSRNQPQAKGDNLFLEMIRERKDSCILDLTKENFEQVKEEAELILKSLSSEYIRELERKAKKCGLEERILIENASSSLFYAIDSLKLGREVLVIAGRGNNGADVLSCARKLTSRGYRVKVAVLEEKALGEEALCQKGILEKIKVPIYSIKRNNIYRLKELFKNTDFILEGILGIGMKGELSPFLKKAISLINNSGRRVVSCDIPSGLSPQEGNVCGGAVKADYTVTFIAPKEGFFLNEGRGFCGKIFVVDIGISRQILEEVASSLPSLKLRRTGK